MKTYGITKKLDGHGRIVIPKDFRHIFNIKENEELEIFATDKGILLCVPETEIIRKIH